jgi:hypothetical protein
MGASATRVSGVFSVQRVQIVTSAVAMPIDSMPPIVQYARNGSTPRSGSREQ